MLSRIILVGILAMAPIGFGASSPPPTSAPVYSYRIVNTYPHDPNAFTQGLVYRDGVLYESTGLRGRSDVRRVELESGRVLARRPLLPLFFAAGRHLREDVPGQLEEIAREHPVSLHLLDPVGQHPAFVDALASIVESQAQAQ